MIQFFIRFFSPPVFEGDEEKSLYARQLTRINNALLISTIAYTFLIPVILGGLPPRMYLILPLYIIAAGVRFLIQKGKIRASSHIFTAGIWLVLLASEITSGGVLAPAFPGNIIVILSAAILLGQTSALIYAGLSAGSGIFLIIAERQGIIPIPEAYITSGLTWLANAIYFAVAITLLAMANENIRAALERARRNERNLAERTQTLIASEARWRAVVENAPNTIINVNREGTITFINNPRNKPDLVERITGKKIFDLMPKEQEETIRQAINEAFAALNPATFEGYMRLDKPRWYRLQVGAVRSPDGQTDSATIIATDLSSQRKMVQALTANQSVLQRQAHQLLALNKVGQVVSTLTDLNTVLKNILDAIRSALPLDVFYVAIYDEKTNMVSFPIMYDDAQLWDEPTQVCEEDTYTMRAIRTRQPFMANRSPEEVAADVDSPDNFIGAKNKNSASILAVPLQIGEKMLGIISAHSYSFNAYTEEHLALLKGASYQIAIAIENARLYEELQKELNERKALVQELKTKNTELERFTHTVSHDLRSPLFTISGFLGYIEKDAVAGNIDKVKMDLQRVTDAVIKMQNMLGYLLELSRIGRIMNPPQLVPFNEIVREALEMVHGRVEERGAQIKVAGELPKVNGDRIRLVEVVQNLVDNAIKFSGDQPSPLIEIGASGADRDGKSIFYVRDHGIGIEKDQLERVFELFNKLDPKTDGTGIGLALVKRIVEVHGGRIWVESAGPAQGTTFYFTLPN